MNIHPTAVVDQDAELDPSVKVGAYAVIGAGVRIGANSVISPHAVINELTEIGTGNHVGSFANIGDAPQDISYRNEATTLKIGNDNQIREYVSIHRGTVKGGGQTTIGNNNMLMAYSHIAHDCHVGNHVIMANAATLGGHVTVGDRANFGGFVGVHQFTNIGCYSYVGGMSGVTKDVPPYTIVAGTRNQMRVSGINRIGLKRSGFSSNDIKDLRGAFNIIFSDENLLLQEALDMAISEYSTSELVRNLVGFIRASKRGVVRSYSSDE
ncbi:MAG: acyl-ACP--UDP-N-acetylglucosamine O-acyltransferase [Proteobacteria bacterium]|nr:acyl-ACP--UDP-N-acetylglucosamine O-acyltransferase [Pseudomonadota bacterium]MBU1738608.1 acyl-ACP--UDP-N-acetylglucosamine O-acyltransferase [Pseudomonadota bacterium]